MSITVKPINPDNGSQMRAYVKFGIDLYKGNDCFVPPLIFDEVNTFRPGKNPALDFCRCRLFMAYDDAGKPVGRIAALINDRYNEMFGKKEARWGWTDFVDDPAVAKALFDAAEGWARSEGMTEMVGPMGFTDMDHEGLLIHGFDEQGTMATIYNYAYYAPIVEGLGYERDADWVEYRMKVPTEVPARLARVSEIVKSKFGFKVLKYTSRKKIKADYGRALFELINRAYANLYGYCPLTDRQIDYYIDMYLSLVNLEFITLVVDRDDKLIGVGITIPSLTRALQRSGGKLFPLGWWHLYKAIMRKGNPVVDLMLVAIAPEYQGKGVNALLFADLIPVYIKYGMQWAESNLELEDNASVQSQWEYFERRLHRRRRAYRKKL